LLEKFGAQLSFNFNLEILEYFFWKIFDTLRFGKYINIVLNINKFSAKNEKHSFVSHALLHKYSVFLSLTSFPWLVSQNRTEHSFSDHLFFSLVDINFSFSILFRNNNKNTQSLSFFFSLAKQNYEKVEIQSLSMACIVLCFVTVFWFLLFFEWRR